MKRNGSVLKTDGAWKSSTSLWVTPTFFRQKNEVLQWLSGWLTNPTARWNWGHRWRQPPSSCRLHHTIAQQSSNPNVQPINSILAQTWLSSDAKDHLKKKRKHLSLKRVWVVECLFNDRKYRAVPRALSVGTVDPRFCTEAVFRGSSRKKSEDITQCVY